MRTDAAFILWSYSHLSILVWTHTPMHKRVQVSLSSKLVHGKYSVNSVNTLLSKFSVLLSLECQIWVPCPPSALGHSLALTCSTIILAKCHSSLEADKQTEELRMNIISLKMCVCVCVVQGPVWCWGRPVQSIVWMSPEWNSGYNSRTLTRLCQNRVFRESHLPLSLSVIVSSLLSSLSLFLFFHCSLASLALSDFAVDLTWKLLCQTDVDWWNNLSQGEYCIFLCLSGCVVLDTEFKQLN